MVADIPNESNTLPGQTDERTIAALVVGALAAIGMLTAGAGCTIAAEGLRIEGDDGGHVVLDTPYGKKRVTVRVASFEGGAS